jgi:uncharacterized protein (DUF433 family)
MEGIEVRKGAGGKSAYVGATRVRVSDIARLYVMALEEIIIERMRQSLPDLTPAQIEAAIDYWRANKAEINAEIQQEDELIASIPFAQ